MRARMISSGVTTGRTVAAEPAGQQSADLDRNLALHSLTRSEVPRRTHVHDEHDRQFPLFLENLDEGRAVTSRHIPVDRTNVVPVLVLADLGEIHASSLEYRVVLARKNLVDEASRGDFEATYLLENLTGDHLCRSVREPRRDQESDAPHLPASLPRPLPRM